MSDGHGAKPGERRGGRQKGTKNTDGHGAKQCLMAMERSPASGTAVVRRAQKTLMAMERSPASGAGLRHAETEIGKWRAETAPILNQTLAALRFFSRSRCGGATSPSSEPPEQIARGSPPILLNGVALGAVRRSDDV